ncbi:hypothetical protein ACHAWF_014017, partial [Thalassiosira exigua]
MGSLSLTVKNEVSAQAHPRYCRVTSKHVHLAVGRDPAREMTVSFATKRSDPGIMPPVGGVRVGLGPDKLDRFVPEQEFPLRYNETLPGVGGHMYHAPFQHHITIYGLEPDTTYYYMVVNGNRPEGIEGLANKTLQQQQQQEEDISRLRRKLIGAPYDGTSKACADYDHKLFIDLIYIPAQHPSTDIDKLEHGNQIFLAYENRFRMPQIRPTQLDSYDIPGKLNMNGPPYPLPYEWGNAYYSFAYGPTKHVVISAYSSMDPDSLQYNWLVEELESVDRAVTPWVLATIHTPLYNTFHQHKNDPQILAAKEHLEPLFLKYHVNVLFTGHVHAYQRTKNVAMGRVDPEGPVHLTIGASGRQCKATYMNETAEEWIVARYSSYHGYGRFTVLNKTHAHWEWIPVSLA